MPEKYGDKSEVKLKDKTMEQATIETLEKLVTHLEELESMRTLAEQQLKDVEKAIADIQEVKIPELFGDLSRIETVSGLTVIIENNFYPSITQEKWGKAKDWLKENQLDGVIKNEFKVQFSTDFNDEAEEFKAFIIDRKYKFKGKEFIEPATLKALCKERYGTGIEDTDVSGINVFVKKQAKIKRGIR